MDDHWSVMKKNTSRGATTRFLLQHAQIELECTYSVRTVYVQCGQHVDCIGFALRAAITLLRGPSDIIGLAKDCPGVPKDPKT